MSIVSALQGPQNKSAIFKMGKIVSDITDSRISFSSQIDDNVCKRVLVFQQEI